MQKHLRRNHWEQQHGKANIDDLIKKIKLESLNSGKTLITVINYLFLMRMIVILLKISVEETENDVTDGISVVIVGDESSFNEIT